MKVRAVAVARAGERKRCRVGSGTKNGENSENEKESRFESKRKRN